MKRLLEQAEAADAEKDGLYGKDRTGDELPAELERRETRLKKIKEAKRAVEERARQKAGGGRQRSEAGQAQRQGLVQLHRSGVAHHERRGRVRADIQRASRGGTGVSIHSGPDGDAGGQR